MFFKRKPHFEQMDNNLLCHIYSDLRTFRENPDNPLGEHAQKTISTIEKEYGIKCSVSDFEALIMNEIYARFVQLIYDAKKIKE